MQFDCDQGRFKPVQKNIYGDDEDLLDLLDEINRYKERHIDFRFPPIISSLKECVENKGFLTPKQYNILLNIYYTNSMFNMPEL